MDRETLLALDRVIAEARQVELSDPTIPTTDDTGAPAGVGVESMPVSIASCYVTAAELAETGLRPEDVPNIRIFD